MSRSTWKLPFYITTDSMIKDKSITIIPTLLGQTISIYNGKKLITITITSEHINKRVGQLVTTKKKIQTNK